MNKLKNIIILFVFFIFVNIVLSFCAGPIGTLGYVLADKSELNSFYVGAGGEIGYRWLKKRGFTFGINLLISYILGEITFEKATASFVGLNYELNAKVGYVW
jgi:hypothetical protein